MHTGFAENKNKDFNLVYICSEEMWIHLYTVAYLGSHIGEQAYSPIRLPCYDVVAQQVTY